MSEAVLNELTLQQTEVVLAAQPETLWQSQTVALFVQRIRELEQVADLLTHIVRESSYTFIGHEGQEPYRVPWVTFDSTVFVSESQAQLLEQIAEQEAEQ